MRRLHCLMIALALICAMAGTASAYSASGEYSLGTSNLGIFSGVVTDLPYGNHYVYWRNSQYEYMLAYGPGLSVSGSSFSSEEPVTLVTYKSYSSYQSVPTFTVSSANSFQLSAGNYLVYSDLSGYPKLVERGGVDYAKTSCVILCSFMLYYLFHHMWADIRQRYLDG